MTPRPALAVSAAVAALALSLGTVPATAAPATSAGSAATSVSTVTTARHTPARASRATRATVDRIYLAIAADEQMRGWKRADWRVQRVSVTSSGTWARATIHPTRGQTDDATVVLRKVKGRWTVVDLGTAQVGCGIAPSSVMRSLRLGGC